MTEPSHQAAYESLRDPLRGVPGIAPLLDFRLRYSREPEAWERLTMREVKELFDAALEHIDALQDRIDALPEEPCHTCRAVACCCAYDWPGARCGLHSPRNLTRAP